MNKLYRISLRDSLEPTDCYDTDVYFNNENWWNWLNNYDLDIPEDLLDYWMSTNVDDEPPCIVENSGSITNDKAQIITLAITNIPGHGAPQADDEVVATYKGLWY